MTTRRRIVVCYILGILGYALGMALSLHGQLPAALLSICATAALAPLALPPQK